MRSSRHTCLIVLLASFGAFAFSAHGQEASVPLAISNRLPVMHKWAADSVIRKAVVAQNAEKLAMEEIMRRDEAWRKSARSDPFKHELTRSPCANALRGFAGNDRAVMEAFVMDNQGALVCSLLITTDYWQGDEAKWQKSFTGGKGSDHVAEPEFDASTKITLVQASVPVTDGEQAIGVLMVGFNARLLRINAEPGK